MSRSKHGTPGPFKGYEPAKEKRDFAHRRQSIYLSSELRVPEWGAALLEEWLMSMRSAINRPKDRTQRINEIKRLRTSIERNLESASLDKVMMNGRRLTNDSTASTTD